jgi:phosphoglucomutase
MVVDKLAEMFILKSMVNKNDINEALDKMILSASGWRGVFSAYGNEEGNSGEISQAHRIICGAAALVFAEYLQVLRKSPALPWPFILIGSDTRPTGKAIIETMIPVIINAGCDVRYAGVMAAPEIMAWARKTRGELRTGGFIYISASHNPIGHNGIKFGLLDGGVLAAEETEKLIANFRSFFERSDCISKIESIIASGNYKEIENIYAGIDSYKAYAYKSYFEFCGDVVWGYTGSISTHVKEGLAKRPLGIVCDFNGSARTVSIDRRFFSSLGIKFEFINSEPGNIAHRIVPEVESLEPCKALLEKVHGRDASFVLGYMPDCDGDRGNLVIWDDAVGKARALEAQEVFALACAAELAHFVWMGEDVSKAAVAVNDPTSMRIDRIAEAFGVSVFRAEVGEANVVGLARKLRKDGYFVRILGEGSAGGNITHPSAVRDPINTVLAIVKLLSVRSKDGTDGLFEIWCKCSGQGEKYHDNFTLADIIESLPKFATSPAYSDLAVLKIKTTDHATLKDRYKKVFLREWEGRRDELKTRFGIHDWEAIAYNGMEEKRKLAHFGDAGKGGLKILFFDKEGKATSYIWMRGSATEPVFRIMADAPTKEAEQYLLDWQRCMIMEADTKE